MAQDDVADFRAPGEPAWWEARKLVRAASAGVLATQAGGQPFAALVTPATAVDGSILLLLSGLSEHTRQLRADGRCAVMVSGANDDPNPQAGPRVTVSGVAVRTDDPRHRARWLARHPYAAFYAGLGDFTMWRVQPSGANFIGGFARAFRLGRDELLSGAEAVVALEAAEAGIVARCNAERAEALAALGARVGGEAGTWRMVGVDPDGVDLGLDERVARVAFAEPVGDAAEVQRELVRLVGEQGGKLGSAQTRDGRAAP